MSRLTGADAKGLMEAYNNVYAPQELTEEQVWEEVESWVSSLLEEGYDLSDYTWEEMYEGYIEEKSAGEFYSTPGKPKPTTAQLQQRSKNIDARGGWGGQAYRAINRAFGAKEPSWDKADRDDRRREQTALNRAKDPNWKPTLKKDPKPEIDRNRNLEATTPATPKVSPTKPAPSAQTGDKTKDMATWASTPANKGLAAAAAEKARIRGTSQSDNPLMKGMPGKRPMTPSVQSPTLAKDLGKGSGNQSLLNNPNASKAAPPKPAATPTAPAVSPTPAAAKTTPTPVTPKAPTGGPRTRAQVLGQSYEYDAYDLVLEYLLSEGHADTVEEAHYVMIEMDAETIGSIIEERIDRDPRGRVSSGPMNVYPKPEGKPSQTHLDAVAAHRESEKKKSPEQKKKELADYIQRQRENK